MPFEETEGVWDLEGHTAWKHRSGFYGVSFTKVYDSVPDGVMGPLFLYHDRAGLVLASIRNKNRSLMRADGAAELTWATIAGTLDGVPFHPEMRGGSFGVHKRHEWAADKKSYRVTGRVVDRKSGKEFGTLEWAFDLSGEDGVGMQVTAALPELKDAVVSLPFYREGGENKGEIVRPGLFRFTARTGVKVDLHYPESVPATLVPEMTADTFALRLPLPTEGKLSLRFSVAEASVASIALLPGRARTDDLEYPQFFEGQNRPGPSRIRRRENFFTRCK